MKSFAAINKDIAGTTATWRDMAEDPEALVRDGLSFRRDKAAKYNAAS